MESMGASSANTLRRKLVQVNHLDVQYFGTLFSNDAVHGNGSSDLCGGCHETRHVCNKVSLTGQHGTIGFLVSCRNELDLVLIRREKAFYMFNVVGR